MCSLRLKRADFAGWPDALWITAAPLTLVLVPQVGGRIMGLQWKTQDVFWVNPELAGQPLAVSRLSEPGVDKQALGFLLWGGNKTWLAPQEQWLNALPFIDLDSGPYTVTGITESPSQVVVTLRSPVCRESGMQITRQLTVEATGWHLNHTLANCGDRPASWGIWSNSMVCRPAQVWLPLGETSQFQGGVKTFVQEGDSLAARSHVVEQQAAMAIVHCEAPRKFKFGVDSDQGRVLTVMPLESGAYLGWLTEFEVRATEPYGHGCTAEVFNAAAYDYLEVEIHSPVRSLAPGETLTFTEVNRLGRLRDLPATSSDVAALLPTGEFC